MGEDFGKVIQDFVKAPVNSGKSVRQQRETVYHLYAKQQIQSQEAGQPEPSTREPDKQEVCGIGSGRRWLGRLNGLQRPCDLGAGGRGRWC
jgi:hypothetical protein